LAGSATESIIGITQSAAEARAPFDPKARTAVLMVNGFNGLGLHTTLSVIRFFGKVFRNFVFIQVGVVDADVFKGAEEISHLEQAVKNDLDRYVAFMRRHGYFAEGISAIGTDSGPRSWSDFPRPFSSAGNWCSRKNPGSAAGSTTTRLSPCSGVFIARGSRS
jgi:hypothetical protein